MYHSQFQQDEILDVAFFKGKREGFFVDVGAHDGVTFNNTLFFEESYDWTGINIEPIQEVFTELEKNRKKCINLNCAVSDVEGEADFTRITGYSEMLSGLTELYHPDHVKRIDREVKEKGGDVEQRTVQVRRLDRILAERGVTHVDFLSIDVEGAEMGVIRSIDFDKVRIDVIVFEKNYEQSGQEIICYLQNKGYVLVLTCCDVFMRHPDFVIDVNDLRKVKSVTIK